MSAITINATNTFTNYTIPSEDSNDIIISFHKYYKCEVL